MVHNFIVLFSNNKKKKGTVLSICMDIKKHENVSTFIRKIKDNHELNESKLAVSVCPSVCLNLDF